MRLCSTSRTFISDDRAFASGFVVLIITIFVVVIGYIATMLAYDKLHSFAVDQAGTISDQDLSESIFETLAWADTIYVKLPLTILFGVLMYAILNAMRREPRTFQR